MITGLKKKQKTTEIYFNEADDITTISTYNTKLKNRLLEFSKEYPDLCKLISDDELGCLVFEINKDSFTFRCMKPPRTKSERSQGADEQVNWQDHRGERNNNSCRLTKSVCFSSLLLQHCKMPLDILLDIRCNVNRPVFLKIGIPISLDIEIRRISIFDCSYK